MECSHGYEAGNPKGHRRTEAQDDGSDATKVHGKESSHKEDPRQTDRHEAHRHQDHLDQADQHEEDLRKDCAEADDSCQNASKTGQRRKGETHHAQHPETERHEGKERLTGNQE